MRREGDSKEEAPLDLHLHRLALPVFLFAHATSLLAVSNLQLLRSHLLRCLKREVVPLPARKAAVVAVSN
jgi:hypothetical protein